MPNEKEDENGEETEIMRVQEGKKYGEAMARSRTPEPAYREMPPPDDRRHSASSSARRRIRRRRSRSPLSQHEHSSSSRSRSRGSDRKHRPRVRPPLPLPRMPMPLSHDVLLQKDNDGDRGDDAKRPEASDLPSQQIDFQPLFPLYLSSKEDLEEAIRCNGSATLCPRCKYENNASKSDATIINKIDQLLSDFGTLDDIQFVTVIQEYYNKTLRPQLKPEATGHKAYWSREMIREHALHHRLTPPEVHVRHFERSAMEMIRLLEENGLKQVDEKGNAKLHTANAKLYLLLWSKIITKRPSST